MHSIAITFSRTQSSTRCTDYTVIPSATDRGPAASLYKASDLWGWQFQHRRIGGTHGDWFLIAT